MSCCSNKNKKNSSGKSCCEKPSQEQEGKKKLNYSEEIGMDDQVKEALAYFTIKHKLVFWKKVSGALALFLIVSLVVQFSGASMVQKVENTEIIPRALAAEVLPEEGVELPIAWGDLGKQMIEAGVIDAEKFEKLYERRGGMGVDTRNLLYNTDNEAVVINSKNSGELLNLFWAFGLSNKSSILETGLMTTYDGKKPTSKEEALEKAGGMASTGGWPLSIGKAMDHYSVHEFVALNPEEWKLVERVASGIFRPCCNNPTHFPDCNHGMAMLGFLELLAASGATEEEMFNAALSVNSYWFPSTYLTIAEYMSMNGIAWNDVDSKEVLSAKYSSGSGFATVQRAIEPVETNNSGGGCGA